MGTIETVFEKIASRVAHYSGSHIFFFYSLAFIVIWALCGRYFGYSDGWQLVINTSTTIITFLVAIITQYTLKKESEDLHKKLDKLIKLHKDEK